MKINPIVGVWCNFIALLLTGVGAGAVQWGKLDPSTVDLIKVLAANSLFVLTSANLVFGLYSSNAKGPLA